MTHEPNTPQNQDIQTAPAVRAAFGDPGHRRHQFGADVDQLPLFSENHRSRLSQHHPGFRFGDRSVHGQRGCGYGKPGVDTPVGPVQ
ncbi:hypothetical protein DESC_720061 [Desulfosarcina cetonica]|nr:hypothetical protein DESC_720061 [Desulfosarcina cetonica]